MTAARLSIGLGLTITVACISARAGELLIVAHPDNPIKSITVDQARAIFTLQMTRTTNADIRPVDLPETSPARAQLLSKLGIDPQKLVSQRARQIFSGNGFPPIKAQNEAEVVSLVSNSVSLIGYLPKESAGTGLAVLLRLPAN